MDAAPSIKITGKYVDNKYIYYLFRYLFSLILNTFYTTPKLYYIYLPIYLYLCMLKSGAKPFLAVAL